VSERIVRPYSERMAGYRRVLEARSRTTPARLRELAGDEIRPVRLWTARNIWTPADALDLLADDPDDSVVWNVLLNRQTPARTLERLSRREAAKFGDRYFIDRERIAHHPLAPEALREALLLAGACKGCSRYCQGWRVYTDREE
jgi:hypothetical protein